MASTLPTPASECCNTVCSTCTDISIEDLIAQALSVSEGFGTNAALRAYTTHNDGQVAHVFGTAVRGDASMRVFYFDAVSMLVDNDASVIKPSNINILLPGRWIQSL